VASLARALADRGVGTGDRVVTVLPTTPESILLCLATQWAGGVYVPLNPALTTEEADLLITDAEPAVTIVGEAALTPLLDAALAHLGTVDGLHPTPRDPDDPAAIIYTS